MPDRKESNQTSSNSLIVKTVAGIAIGAAMAFGAYFYGKAEGQEEAQHSYQNRVNVALNMNPHPTNCSDNDDNDKISRDCDICRRSFKYVIDKGEEIHSTPCGHIFCKRCIDTTLNLRSKCPICNIDVSPNETHRIFL